MCVGGGGGGGAELVEAVTGRMTGNSVEQLIV